MKEAIKHRKGFFHFESLSPYVYIVLLRKFDTVIAKKMEQDKKMTSGEEIVVFFMNLSTSQGNNAEEFSIFDFEIPFPLIIIVVFLLVLGVLLFLF